MTSRRYDALLSVLRRSSSPLSGDELAAALHVSTRTVRAYVKQINARAPLIQSAHGGYELTREGRKSAHDPLFTVATDTPAERLTALARTLIQATAPISVFDLTDRLFVSDSTLEADLRRVRELVRQHDLVLRREGEMVRIEGPEVRRRRLLQQLLMGGANGFEPATLRALDENYPHLDVSALREHARAVFRDRDLKVSEFTLNDIVIHLAITIDRIEHGHGAPAIDGHRPSHAVMEIADALANGAEDVSGVEFTAAERDGLALMLGVRGVGATPDERDALVDPHLLASVRKILVEIASKYLIPPNSDVSTAKVALHVQNLHARQAAGAALHEPLGRGFARQHPFIHDLALDFASKMEAELGIVAAPGEIDYLALHLGRHYLKHMQDHDVVRVTLVCPSYHDLADELAQRLATCLRGSAIIEAVETRIDVDFAAITSDVIVTVVEPTTATSALVIPISALPATDELERVGALVRRERERAARRRIAGSLATLIDPALFVRVPHAGSPEEAIGLLADRLLEAGYTDEHFLTDVLDREHRSPTAFGGEFAIPHSMHMDSHETAIAVLVSDEPIRWSGSDVRLVLLFALSPSGRGTFREVFDGVIALLGEGRNVTTLVNAASDAPSFLSALTQLMEPGAQA